MSGNLHLNTGTFTYEDIIDYDRSKNIGGSLNLSHSFGGPKGESQANKANQTMAGGSDAFKRSSFGVDGSYEKKDKEGITRATVGAGTLNVQDKAKQAELENTGKTQKLANINRDLTATQEITKDERSYVGVYVTDTSVKRAIEGVETVGRVLSEVTTELFGELGRQGNEDFAKLARAKRNGQLTDESIISQLAACGSRQGFNLWNLFISPAHAASAECSVKTRDGQVIILSEHERKQCIDAYLEAAAKQPGFLEKLSKLKLSDVLKGAYAGAKNTLGNLSAIYKNGPVVAAHDEDGNPYLYIDTQGRSLYKNELTGQYFLANPNDPVNSTEIIGGGAEIAAYMAGIGWTSGVKSATGATLGSGAVRVGSKSSAASYAAPLVAKLESAAGDSVAFASATKEVWKAGDWTRGIAIEKYLARTDYNGMQYVGELNHGFFKTVDFSGKSTAISLKTTRYGEVNFDSWFGTMQAHVVKLAERKFDAPVGKVDSVRLDIRIPKGRNLSPDHQRLINDLASRTGVRIDVKNF